MPLPKKSLRDEKPWVLSRLDDNGNEYDMDRFASEEEAERERRKFEARGHKQSYYVRLERK